MTHRVAPSHRLPSGALSIFNKRCFQTHVVAEREVFLLFTRCRIVKALRSLLLVRVERKRIPWDTAVIMAGGEVEKKKQIM